MHSPVLERLVGGAVLLGLLLLLALVIGPREGVRMPDEEGSKVPVAQDAPQSAESAVSTFSDTPGNGAEPISAPRWTAVDSASKNEPENARSLSRTSAGNVASSAQAADEATRGAGEAEGPGAVPEATAGVVPGDQWAVQVGSFTERANADRLSQWCREQGYGVKVVTRSGDKLYRVHVGPFSSRADAESTVARLALRGRQGFIADWQGSSQ